VFLQEDKLIGNVPFTFITLEKLSSIGIVNRRPPPPLFPCLPGGHLAAVP
jgi:hypothetical protein